MNVTGTITFFQSQVGSIANHDTDALTEGSNNLYFTDERVDDRVASLITGGTGISATYDDAGNMLTLSAVQLTSIPTISHKDLQISSTLSRCLMQVLQVSLLAICLRAPTSTSLMLALMQEQMLVLLQHLLQIFLKVLTFTTQMLVLMRELMQGLLLSLRRIYLRVPTSISLMHVLRQQSVHLMLVLVMLTTPLTLTSSISTATQTALDDKADLASPSLTGTPTAPTPAQSDDSTQIATTAFVQSNLTASLLRSALGIPEYANNGGANSGGLSSGDVYFNTTTNTYTTVS